MKDRYPDFKLHALSPPEVVHLSRLSQLPVPIVIERLVAAGLDSIPGGGAEILVDRVRKQLHCYGKATSDEWLEVMRHAHRAGLRTTATMMYGTVETDEERILGVEPVRPDYRVLIVEDVEENRLVLERLMQNAGFQVRLAEDGERGVEIFESWRPHFIWMDLRMPVMDGKEATRRIRALDGGLEVKIAAVTASAFISEREEVLAAGVDDFIRKPYHPSEIFDCMARHLGLRRIYGKRDRKQLAVALGKEDLNVLPRALVSDLAAAVATLDGNRIREVIARISESNAAVGQKLGYFADRYTYTAILDAIREGEESRGPKSSWPRSDVNCS